MKLPSKMRGVTQLVEIFRGYALANSSPTPITTQIPVDRPIVALHLRINHSLTIGTGSGAVSEGELLKTKAITFQTDRSEYIVKNVPGRALYRLNQVEFGSAGQKDAVAAATAVYSVLYCIPFVNQKPGLLIRPFDTVLNPKRYKSYTLTITEGAVSDLLGTVGTATVATTCDLYAEYLQEDLPAEAMPIFTREIGLVQPVNPSNFTFSDLERAQDLIYTGLLIGSDNSATAGVAFSGTPANTVLSDLSVETNNDFHVRTVLADALNRKNKWLVAESAFPTGRYYIGFIKDGSYASGLFSGELSKLRLTWTNGTLSTSQISTIYDSVRRLKAA